MAVDASFLLFTLNEYLSRTALLVQPLHLAPGEHDEKDLRFVDIPLPLPVADEPRIGGIASVRCGQYAILLSGSSATEIQQSQTCSRRRPQQTDAASGNITASQKTLCATHDSRFDPHSPHAQHICVAHSGEVMDLPTPQGLREAVHTLGLQKALGFVRMLQLSPEDSLIRPVQYE